LIDGDYVPVKRGSVQTDISPLVSVLTPSFNQGRFIERTLESVAIQAGAKIEHLIFDGGSTDDTVEILRRRVPPVYWVSRKDKGQTDAVNQGILASSGEIIGWLNSDDVYYPGTIERVVKFLNGNPQVDVVYGMADHIDTADVIFEAYPTEPWDFERLKETCFISQPAVFFRRRVVDEYGLLDERLDYCMDYEFWLRLGESGARFAYLKEKLAGSRMYADNKTSRARIEVCEEILAMLREKFKRVPDKWLITYAHARAERHFKANSFSFNALLILNSFGLSLKWNRYISKALCVRLYLAARRRLGERQR
jgi:glycosyltransferase involved in cell wall biosynthesis